MSQPGPTKHALCSPSGAEGWMNCVGWTSDSKGSEAADEGTAAHTLAAMCLTEGKAPQAYLGRRIPVGHRTFEVDAEMAGHIERYVTDVLAISDHNTLLVEQELPLTPITGEPDAVGTSDCVILAEPELIIVDLKYGANPRNKVEAEGNKQMMIYALAALEQFGMLGDFKTVRMMIHQPRLGHTPEHVVTVEELRVFAKEVRGAAEHRLLVEVMAPLKPALLSPGKKTCQWCSKKATCPSLASFVEQEVGMGFDDLTKSDKLAKELGGETKLYVGLDTPNELATKMAACDLIEDWIKAVRAEVERRLLAGTDVPGWKLVQGRAGARAWSDATQAEMLFKSMRLKVEQMYDMKVISPTAAEKVLKDQPKRWRKVESLIVRSEGKPSVAPASDKRPALTLTPVVDDFDNIDTGSDLV